MFDFLQSTPTLLTAVAGFIITISFLVTIHEYGHFWMARKFGVKIEKFSVGFGKPIFKWYGKRDNTEYSVSWIPLGGYVKMYGETADENHVEHLKSEVSSQHNSANDISDFTDITNKNTGSFYALPAYKRFLIAFAGPAVNLIFAVLALWFLYVLGVPAFKPYIGGIQPQSVFASGNINSGTKVFSINGNETPTMTEANMYLISNIGNVNTLITTIDDNGIKDTTEIDLSQLPKGSELGISKALGFTWEIAEVGNSIEATISTVAAQSPAEKAGLQPDDTVTQVNKKPINNWLEFVKYITNNPNKALDVVVLRNKNSVLLSLTPGQHPNKPHIGYAGISPKVNDNLYAKYHGLKKYGFLEALPVAVETNYLQAKLTLKMLGRMITGNASIKNMGGPLTIADYSGKTLKLGYVEYLKFLAAISLTLAVMNLLPIPVLDGGHMILYAYEMIRRKPASDKAVMLLFAIGKFVVFGFMILVLTVDVWKYIQ